jgi:hypothetical protein
MLIDNTNHKAMEKLEGELSLNEQTIFSIRSFIDSKGAETNYRPSAEECKSLAFEINKILTNAF